MESRLLMAAAALAVLGLVAACSPTEPPDTTTTTSTTTLAPPVSPIVAAGDYHSCALSPSGGVKCWGENFYGELGNGTTADSSTPVDVTGLTSGITAVADGDYHTCALTAPGGVKCWGQNLYGELGNGTTNNSSTPVDVTGLTSGIVAIAAGLKHTCAVTAVGGVKCWGYNVSGQLGNGTTNTSSTSSPVDVTGLTSGVIAVAAADRHTCARTALGGVTCWGYNGRGELGSGTTTDSSVPVEVAGLTAGATAIATGGNHTCAVTAGGAVSCWGANTRGALGNGTTTDSHVPVGVSGLSSGITAVAAGGSNSCALTTGGGVKCWGYNDDGELGNGTTTDSHVPVDVSGLASGITAIATAISHTCASTESGSVMCWGWNHYGELGNGTTAASSTPVDVTGFP